MRLSRLLIAIVSSLVVVTSIFSPVVLAQDVDVTATPIAAVTPTTFPTATCAPVDSTSTTPNPCVQVNEKKLGFKIPTLSTILTFAIRAVFVIGGLLALLMLLLGAIAWITSGGEKENVQKAQNKLQAAVVGIILIAVVLAIIATLEQVVFKGTICLGLTCPITVPSLLEKTSEGSTASITITVTPTPITIPGTTEEPETITITPSGGNMQGNTTQENGTSSTSTYNQNQETAGPLPTSVILPDTGGHP